MLFTVTLLIVCALVAAASIPLMLRLIPPNAVYGVRTRRTMSDSATWFAVNAFGGKALVIAAAVAALLLMLYNGTLLRSALAQVAAMVLPAIVAVGATLYYERRYPGGLSDRADSPRGGRRD
jgi:uncharacterized membrane protein